MDRCVYWLMLEMIFGFGGKRLRQVMEKNDAPEEVCRRILSGEADSLSDGEKEKAERVSIDEAERLIKRAHELGQQTVCIGDEDYPKRWQDLDDAPALAFYRGDMSIANDSTVIHTVGTREPSGYTLSLINVLCADLALRGFTVSCGLAEGSDTCAAETVLGREGRVLAVYPTSLDRDYPKNGSELKERLMEKGLLISEYPPEYGGRMNFQRRNRLAVALASAVVITEASADSKGLDNAVRALETGRPVLAVPPHILYSKRYFGQRDLLREGCVPLFDGEDVVRVLTEKGTVPKGSHTLPGHALKERERQEKSGGKNTHAAVKKTPEKAAVPVSSMTVEMMDEHEKAVFTLLKERGEMTSDELIAVGGFDITELMPALVSLELERVIEQTPEKRYRLI